MNLLAGGPVGGIHTAPDVAMEARIWPFADRARETMFDRLEVDVIRVALEIPLVTNDMLPEPALPDSALAFLPPSRGELFAGGDGASESRLDGLPA